MEEVVKVEITAPLPAEGVAERKYRIEGTVKIFDAIGAPPWVYAEVKKKEWWRPEVVEETDYKRGFPLPISGDFSIDWTPKKAGIYDVTVLATPAPLSLPVVGVPPVTGKSDVMKITIGEKPEEPVGEFKELKITSYDSVSPPGVLKVNPGQTIRVTSEFDYTGPATTGKIYTAVWHTSWYDPHDEIAHGEQPFSVSDSPSPGKHVKGYVDIKIPEGFAGKDFGLYSKLAVPGPGIFSPYYQNIIEIIAVPPAADIADFDFVPTKGTYNLGAKVPFTGKYKYKGKTQPGQLTIFLGTGIYPSFSTKYTYSPVAVNFSEAVDWKEFALSGNITLPDVLESGQTYSVRAKLETLEVPTQETDTDWGVITITPLVILEVSIEPAGAGYVTTSPAPSGGTQHNWLFPYGTVVYVTAHPNPGYAFDWWSGEMKDTQSNPAPTYPLQESHTRIRAKFKETLYAGPTIETLEATSVGGDSADIHARLISAGSHEKARCHFEWGKTTAYGYMTPYQWLSPDQTSSVKLTGLEPNTTYHFRAVAYTTIATHNGANRSFTTKSVVTPGFQMRAINPPAGATQWRAACVAGGGLPSMSTLQPFSYIWKWTNMVPDYELDFFVLAAGPWQDGFAPTIKYYQFPFRLRNDKKYVFDFGAYYPGIPDIRLMMKEE